LSFHDATASAPCAGVHGFKLSEGPTVAEYSQQQPGPAQEHDRPRYDDARTMAARLRAMRGLAADPQLMAADADAE